MTPTSSYANLEARLRRASTFLFVPGNRRDRFESAARSTADVVILDLEASVHPKDKALARAEVARWLRNPPRHHFALVRLNRLGSQDFVHDWQELSGFAGVGLMCSGAELCEPLIQLLAGARASHPIVLLVETAIGIEQATELARLPGVCRLAFGNMDYATELGLGSDHSGLIYPSSRLAVASRCADLPGPIAGVTANIHERTVLDRDALFERSLGFTGKMCIHPAQIAGARAAFEPTEAECDWARRILAATEQSHAVSLDGEMIDRPVIERAKLILGRAVSSTAGDPNVPEAE